MNEDLDEILKNEVISDFTFLECITDGKSDSLYTGPEIKVDLDKEDVRDKVYLASKKVQRI